MAHDAPRAVERSNPLLWFAGLVVIIAIVGLWFSHWFETGVAHGRGEKIEIPSAKTAEPIDFAKLIADRSDAVLERGATVYSKNCVSCHGPTGQENPTGLQPPPRNYHKDEFKNPNGGGPYGLYTVLENGFNGRMPAQPGLSPADKFAVIHFIRETWVKKDNAANYLANDLPKTQALIPKPGEAAKGPELPPPQRAVPQPVRPLLAATAADSAADAAAADDWLVAAAQPKAAARVAPLVARLADQRGSGAVTTLYRAARAGDDAQVRALLERGDSPLYLPTLAVSAGDANDLVKYLTSTAAATKPSSTGAK